MIPGAPSCLNVPDGVLAQHTIELVDKTVVVLGDDLQTGLALLRIGPADAVGLDTYGKSITLDASACRHLAGLLYAKAKEIEAGATS